MHATVRSMRILALTALLTMTLSRSPAYADVFFEITPAGTPPNGLIDMAIGSAPAAFDVYVWGSGSDIVLRSAEFNITAPPASWNMLSLGTVDPNHRFPGPNVSGTLFPDHIDGVRINSLPGVLLPQSPAGAMRA